MPGGLTGRFIKTSKRSISLEKTPLVMGILNVTPDSFSDGGKYFNTDKAVNYVLQMEMDGADIIDIGGESTRPGSLSVSPEEEMHRVLPVIKKLRKVLKIPVSIDTSKSEVAEAALNEGAEILNDISGLRFDPIITEVAARHKAATIIMHTRSAPRTMQVNVEYGSLLEDIANYLMNGVDRALSAGVDKDAIIIDPGIGFGKSLEQNLVILKNLEYFKKYGYPILIGASRKSFIGKTLNVEVDDRLEGTLAVDALVTTKGIDIIRTHNVLATRRVAAMVHAVEDAAVWVGTE